MSINDPKLLDGCESLIRMCVRVVGMSKVLEYLIRYIAKTNTTQEEYLYQLETDLTIARRHYDRRNLLDK